MYDGRVGAALDEDCAIAAQLGIHSLPTVLVSSTEHAELLGGLAPSDAFVAAFSRISDGMPSRGTKPACANSLLDMMEEHPLMSAQEIVSAFDLDDLDEAGTLVIPLVDNGVVRKESVKGSWFVRAAAKP